ncbi:hypothetical protein LINGRAPRIM_LOCUS1308 [Linum grandiflorum]
MQPRLPRGMHRYVASVSLNLPTLSLFPPRLLRIERRRR